MILNGRFRKVGNLALLTAMLAGCSPPVSNGYKDKNHNGIRDDVDSYIQSNIDSGLYRNAAEHYASALKKVILRHAAEDPKPLIGELSRGLRCIYSVFEGGKNSKHPASVSRKLEDLTFNTNDRKKLYSQFSLSLDGKSWSLPNGMPCN
jgi:hypothetical protein